MSERPAGRKKDSKERRASIREALRTRSIVLIGLMGAGKTAVGRRLAARLDLPFTDADSEIEAAAGQTDQRYLRDYGEPYFREGESAGHRAAVAGTARRCSPPAAAPIWTQSTRANIKAHGISVWLKAELPVLLHRVRRRDNRPLLAPATRRR